MNNKRAMIGTFLLGAITAGALSHYYYAKKIKEWNLASDCTFELVTSQHDLVSTLHILKGLRSGNVTNVINECERNLDASVAGIASMAIEFPKVYPFLTNAYVFEHHRAINDFITPAKKYRETFPYESDDPVTGGKVAAAFALVNVQTNH
jgi:hypothetical protein